MIVFQVNIKHVAISKHKRDPPVASHPNAPDAFSITGQRVKAIARKVEVIEVLSLIKHGQDTIDAVEHVCTNTTSVSALIQALQTAMLDRSDYSSMQCAWLDIPVQQVEHLHPHLSA